MTQQPRSNDPLQQAKAAYEEREKQASKAIEELVSSHGFAEGLAMLTSNVAALTRMGNIGVDQLVRMTRLAGRADQACGASWDGWCGWVSTGWDMACDVP